MLPHKRFSSDASTGFVAQLQGILNRTKATVTKWNRK